MFCLGAKKQAKKGRFKRSKGDKKEKERDEKQSKLNKASKKLIVKPSKKVVKEMKLKTEVVTAKALSKEVVSVGVRAPSDEPREVANTAIISDSDSDADTQVRRKGERKLSDNSLDTWFGE